MYKVSKERSVWILKDRYGKRREESVVRRFIICIVYYYYYYYYFNKIKERWTGHVASVCTIVIGKPGGKNHFEDLVVHSG